MYTTIYVRMADSETPPMWMRLPSLVAGSARVLGQDSGACTISVETTDPAALEADDEVLSYSYEPRG